MGSVEEQNKRQREPTPESEENWNGEERNFVASNAKQGEGFTYRAVDDENEMVTQSIKAYRTEQGNRIEISELQVLPPLKCIPSMREVKNLYKAAMGADQVMEDGAWRGDLYNEMMHIEDPVNEEIQHYKFAGQLQQHDEFPRICRSDISMVEIGPSGSAISRSLFDNIDWRDVAQCTTYLLAQLFEPAVLATHTLDGRFSPGLYDYLDMPKFQLDQAKVGDILHCLRIKSFVDPKIVCDIITRECKKWSDDRRRLRKQRLNF